VKVVKALDNVLVHYMLLLYLRTIAMLHARSGPEFYYAFPNSEEKRSLGILNSDQQYVYTKIPLQHDNVIVLLYVNGGFMLVFHIVYL
jgi:hypothetical protein